MIDEPATRLPDQLVLPTISFRLLDQLVVFVGKPGIEIADADWGRYMEWLKALLTDGRKLGVLVTPGPAPSSGQRSVLLQVLKADTVRVAVLISDPKVIAVVRVMSWFLKNTKPFPANELENALAYLGERDVARVRSTIRDLGCAVPKVAL